MKKLEIKDLHVEVDGTEIIKGITLTFHPGKVHVLMGPNGSGKSTLANALMGHPKYKITKGQIILDGKDITKEKANIRAKEGLFLSFQYPTEITGVTMANFLRTAVNTKREKKYSIVEFHTLLKEKMKELQMDSSFSKRYVNEGFSGGEKKRAEILQLTLLEPKYAILDEPDSGVDRDAIEILSEGIERVRKNKEMAIIIITHYKRILEYLQPDEVSILYKGKIIAQGNYELAKQIEKEGFEGVINK
ncbi:MAG: FeS assembly ATPase SufC [archaeon GW2011_AR17]|nr:MAG: FeS assembly ATPase SufC [archaeon GW2011_AR17]MBS3153891.1 Fe-S cluster assembly ATPase SufC [Candidatus Woesearchaeota archaeon]HIH15492.1 Fe-S cluster assembly ATPase SufC [Nanoarchaeota archaeon]HIH59295.1 Fe-S cluster assembly ATPase SufC [Nanoarchaeota archaeon]HII13910.1 Fe-S cluster assembly ATPase SufC [Nanoarchaeota archaeon]